MEQLAAEIEALRSQIAALKQERAALKEEPLLLEGKSPQDIVEAYRRHARETAQLSAEVKGIDDAIAALEIQLAQRENQFALSPRQWQEYNLRQQLEAKKQTAQLHAERINELARELSSEVKALKAIADEISPLYWQLQDKPFITGFSRVSVPHVRSDGEVWTIMNRVV